jgi:GNAT superfamily N-acetyltransferase
MPAMSTPEAGQADDIFIRSFEPQDADACKRLYREALIGGQLADNDSALDVDDIPLAYMTPEGNHFWVALHRPTSAVIGMIGVIHSDGVGEIRRLRVVHEHRKKGVGKALLETAVQFCKDRNYLKVALDTYIDVDPAVSIFGRHHYSLARTRNYAGKDVRHFYLDLYSSDRKEDET